MAKIVRTTAVADNVVAALRKQVRGVAWRKVTLTLYPYSNGRERGWTVVSSAIWWSGGPEGVGITVAEFRNSDEIVVYPGTNPFLHGGQPVTDEVYKRKIFYQAGLYDRAAGFMVQWLAQAVVR